MSLVNTRQRNGGMYDSNLYCGSRYCSAMPVGMRSQALVPRIGRGSLPRRKAGRGM